jgi:hypothetical protein
VTLLTEEQAYAAMFNFLEQHYRRGETDVIGVLLGSMSLLRNGGTADPAMADDWKNAVAFVLGGGKTPFLELR